MKYVLFIIFILISFDAFPTVSSFTDTPESLISLNFNHISVRDVLQLLAQMHHQNIIISDTVKGEMSIHLQQVSWEKALEIILQEQGLEQQKIGNVMMIASFEEFAARKDQQWQMQQALQRMAPLQETLIPIQYSKAEDIAAAIKNNTENFLSSRGNVSVDVRTNALWVVDIPEKITQIRYFIHQIDIPIRQVLIEARIVSVDQKYEQELGIRFGVTRPENNLSGTFAGANTLAENTKQTAMTHPLDRLNVDLPAVNTGRAASVGLALATLGGGTLLDLELSALETEGGGEIISSPRLMTANQQPASILSGQEIPYQESTSSGATNVNFQKAVLSLTVTPQITPEGKMVLNLQVTQDRPSSTLVQGYPSIETRQIQTQVLVGNGQTVVLGGIYEQDQQKQVERIPFLGDLPFVGGIFRHTFVKKERRELLIFITPKIVSD